MIDMGTLAAGVEPEESPGSLASTKGGGLSASSIVSMMTNAACLL